MYEKDRFHSLGQLQPVVEPPTIFQSELRDTFGSSIVDTKSTATLKVINIGMGGEQQPQGCSTTI